MDDMNVCEGCLEPRRMPACRIVHVALMLLLWTAPVLTSVYWNPGDDILRHNNEFTEVQRVMAERGVDVQRVGAPPRLEDEIVYVNDRYARPDAEPGNRLDIFRVEASWLASMTDRLVDMKDYFTQEELDQFDPRSVEGFTFEGKVLAIPSFLDFTMLFYRKDLLEKYNFTVPKTWDELEAASLAISRGESEECGCQFAGFMWQGAPNEILTTLVFQWVASHGGGTFFDSESGNVTINNAQARAAVERAKSWLGGVTPSSVPNQHLHETKIPFLMERAAFLADLSHLIGEVHHWKPDGCEVFQCGERAFAENVGVAHMPGLTEDLHYTNPWYFGWSVNKFTPELNETMHVVKYLASRQQQMFKAVANEDIPTLLELQTNDTATCKDRPPPTACSAAASNERLLDRPLRVIGANYFPMSTVIFTKMQDYLVGDIPTSHQLVEEWECDLHNIVHPTRWHARCNPIPPAQEPELIVESGSDGISVVVYIVTVVAVVLLCGGLVMAIGRYYRHVHRRAGSWVIKRSELVMSDPPIVLGRGTYGLVVKAQYRDTEVAVKRVLPSLHRAPTSALGTSSMAGLEQKLSFRSLAHDMNMHGARPSTALGIQAKRATLANVEGGAALGSESANNSLDVPGKQEDATSVHGKTEGAGDLETGQKGTPPVCDSVSTLDSGLFSLEWRANRRSSQASSSSASWWGYSSLLGSRSFTAKSYSKPKDVAESNYKALYEEFQRDIQAVVFLRHPCIITVMGAVDDSDGGEPLLVMENAQRGSLYDLLQNQTVELEVPAALRILQDVVSGMKYLHSAEPPVLHNDLKAGNVLVHEDFHAKLADFALSVKKKAAGLRGTPFWMAPELLVENAQPTTKSDVYAFGVLLFEMLTRQEPYSHVTDDVASVLEQVADLSRVEPFRPFLPPNMPSPMSDLIRSCWHPDPERRPSFDIIGKQLEAVMTCPGATQWVSQLHLTPESAERLKGAETGSEPQPSAGELRCSATKRTSLLNDLTSPSARVLLEQVFPKRVATRLLAGLKVEPEHHQCVTILFTDIVGFTEISSQVAPMKVMDMLGRLYHKLDDVAHEHGVFKVETIGDSYMAVANLIEPQPDHTARIAAFALEAISAASTTMVDTEDPARGYVNIRVGVHSGPVVASVVGQLNPRYCLFGDTVNTASRMESTSKTNMVHLSDTAASLLRAQAPHLILQERGWMSIKGKGQMLTFWLHRWQRSVVQRPLLEERTLSGTLNEQMPPGDSGTQPSAELSAGRECEDEACGLAL